jgi:glycerol-3-phosphate dehydrogenase
VAASGQLEQLLDAGREWALFDYEDAQCEFPERIVAEWLGEAVAAGAVVRNHTAALHIGRVGGKVRTVRARDLRSGTEWRVEAEWVINASGPWVDAVLGASRIPTGERLIGGVRGSHIVLPRFEGAPAAAVYTEAPDGRPMFLVPWNGQVLVGATEVPDHSDPGRSAASAGEIEYLFRTFKKMFPRAAVTAADIRYAYSGVRPLPYTRDKTPAAVTRRHALHHHADDGAAGLISVIGGKLTTAASLAREVARAVGVRAAEPALPLVAPAPADGIQSTLDQWARQVAAIAGIDEASARAISEWHGRRAMTVARLAGSDPCLRVPLCDHCDHVVAEAVEAVHFESAVTLADILLRRVPVGLNGACDEACADQAAARIGTALGWGPARIEQEKAAYGDERARFLQRPDLAALNLSEAAQRAA